MDEINISQYAKENGQSYKQVWSSIKDGTFEGKTVETKTGRIKILQESKTNTPKKISFVLPSFSDSDPKESIASVRRNRAATSTRTDEFAWIENGLDVFTVGNRNSSGNDTVSPNEAIRLCQKAYHNFSELANVLNCMSEFSTSPIYLQGGTKKSRDFFEALFKKINIDSLQEKFFLEYYRSGNVFPYRLEAVIKDEDLNNINKVYGTKAAKDIKLPVKYIIINPASITAAGSISFSGTQFYQQLSAYEVQRLKKPVTEEDKNFYNSLSKETQNEIKNGSVNSQILLPLNPEYFYAIFWKKMDYEPMGIPMTWGILRLLNWKMEMQHIDMAVARVTQRAILVITMGYEDKDGNYMFDAKAAEAMRNLFESESVGKTLIADFTTKVTWAIPDVAKLLGPEKYTQVNQEISSGINNILSGSNEKFANQSIKVKLFIQRLTQAREVFINEFLAPEIKRISKLLNFKSYPNAKFTDIDLKDEDLFARILAQLAGIGYLTPPEVFEGMESGRLPTGDESEESQRKFKQLKDEGLYLPAQLNPSAQLDVLSEQNKQAIKLQDKQLEHDDKQKTKDRKHAAENPIAPAPSIHINAPTKMAQPNGRPTGTSTPKKQSKPSKPSKASDKYSQKKIYENLVLASTLTNNIKSELCKKCNIKKLNEEQNILAESLAESIIVNENKDNWLSSVGKYISNPDYENPDKINEISNILNEHGDISYYLAGILNNSKIEGNDKEEENKE